MIKETMLDKVSLNSLKIFNVVAESGSFVKAAQNLFITQPAISKAIKTLEMELNCTLISRSSKKIHLTKRGKELQNYLIKAFNLIETGLNNVQSLNDFDCGNIKIGIQSHLARFYLFDKIKKFQEYYPNIKIQLIDLPTKELISALENYELDFVIDSSPISIPFDNLYVKTIASLKTCFVAGVDYPNEIKNIKDLESENIILPLARSSLRRTLENKLISKGIVLKPYLEVETTDLILEAVRRNFGIGFVIEAAAKVYVEENKIKIVDTENLLPKLEINYIGIKNFENAIAEKFFKEVLFSEGG